MSLYDSRDLEELRVLMDRLENAACNAHQCQLTLNEARHNLTKFIEKLTEEREK